MSDTIREQIISALITRLEEMRTTRGYNTSAGLHVFRARPLVDPDDTPCVALFPRPEEASREYGNNAYVMDVSVQAFQKFESSDPSEVAEQLLGDVIECMTARKYTISFTGGGTEQVEPGDTVTGATSGATGLVDSVSLSTGAWADGDAAGTITMRRVSGTFQNGENLNISEQNNVATTASTASRETPETGGTGGLADDIRYTGGGTESYPAGEDTTVGTEATFAITYRVLSGNPYSQP